MKHPGDGGFTLTEALVALIVISLSLAGIVEAGGLVARANKQILRRQDDFAQIQNFKAEASAKLVPIAPISGDDLKGDDQTMVFPCEAQTLSTSASSQSSATSSGAAKTYDCSLKASSFESINGLGAAKLQFSYLSDGRVLNYWPPQTQTNEQAPKLEGIELRSSEGVNLAIFKLQVEQGPNCQFDMISRSCRNLEHE